ncbi:MAG: hypothetical protein QXU32_00475 [Nitrososphaerales archaeon]
MALAESDENIYFMGGSLERGLSVSRRKKIFSHADWKKIVDVDIEPTISIELSNQSSMMRSRL